MKPADTFNFSYIELVTALGNFQKSTDTNSNEITKELLGFFQSEYAYSLLTNNAEKVEIIKSKEPKINRFLATLHIYDTNDRKLATIEKELEAKTLFEAESIINKTLKMGDWATVKPLN